MVLNGIPISEDQCIGDSLQYINSAFQTLSTNTVTDVTGTLPITVTGTTTQNVSIAAATTSTAGSMSSTDKTRLDDASSVNGLVKCNGSGNFSAATAGTDYGSFTLATSQTASGASVNFASIPSWVKRITVMFNDVSMSGNNHVLIQIGSSGTPQATGYFSNSAYVFGTNVTSVNSTSGFIIFSNNNTNTIGGLLIITKLNGNNWVSSGNFVNQSQHIQMSSGRVTLSNNLDNLTIKSASSDTFDTGTINISYE